MYYGTLASVYGPNDGQCECTRRKKMMTLFGAIYQTNVTLRCRWEHFIKLSKNKKASKTLFYFIKTYNFQINLLKKLRK